jgi:hypothetical protein
MVSTISHDLITQRLPRIKRNAQHGWFGKIQAPVGLITVEDTVGFKFVVDILTLFDFKIVPRATFFLAGRAKHHTSMITGHQKLSLTQLGNKNAAVGILRLSIET